MVQSQESTLKARNFLTASWIKLLIKAGKRKQQAPQIRIGILSEHSLFQLLLVTATAWTSLFHGPKIGSKFSMNSSMY